MNDCDQYVAVHGGAGMHARANDDTVKRAMRRCVPLPSTPPKPA